MQLSSSAEGIGARPTGTEAETRAAAWIQDHLTGWGYEVQNQPFTYTRSGTEKHSQNVVAELKGQSDKVILIGAHYDSTGEKKGSEGATDNGAGVAALLAVAEALRIRPCPTRCASPFGAGRTASTAPGPMPPASMAPPSPNCWPW